MARVLFFAAWGVIGAVSFCPFAARAADQPDRNSPSHWLPLYNRTAAEYELFRDPAHREKLELKTEPVYKWTANSADGANGAVYVWTHRGCAEAVGCFWRFPHRNGSSTLKHELHSLAPVVLCPKRGSPDPWVPRAGLQRRSLHESRSPALSPAKRLSQMRAMGQRFSAHSIAPTGERRELRLLTTPLYRYESADPAVIDGALFAFVCNVGTDPEIFLLLEAREEPGGPRWQFALARFGSRDLFVNEGDREVWRAVRGVEDTINYNPDRTYWLTGEANVAPP